MSKAIAATVLVLAFAVAAQAGRGTDAHFTASPSPYTDVGGAGIGGGSIGGSGAILHVPPTRFAMRAVSGSASEYIPSTFMAYDSAVAEGKASIAARPEPLGTFAEESIKPAAKNAKLQIVQKQDGGLTIQQ
jgi:hypothetical protein